MVMSWIVVVLLSIGRWRYPHRSRLTVVLIVNNEVMKITAKDDGTGTSVTLPVRVVH